MLAALFICLFVPAVCAGAEDFYIDEDVQQLFTSENGLPSSAIVAVAQTPEGFIWLGGYGGLVRYDGDQFVDYEEGHLFNITNLLCGQDGTLWIASSDSGLVSYKNDKFTFLNNSDEENWTKEMECLAEAADGTIYFGTEQGIGYADKDGALHKLQFPQLEGVMIRKIACGNDGEIVCVARSGEAFFCKDDVCKKLSLSIGDAARCVVFDKKENLFYIGSTQDQVIVCNPSLEEEQILKVEGLECINDIKKDADGNLWACADNGVAAVYVDGKTLVQNLEMNNSIDSMLIDREENYWFASSRQGVLLVSRKGHFKNISNRAKLPEIIVNAITKLDDRLYVGHDEGMVILDAKSCEQIADERFAFLSGVRIRNLFVDKEDSLWVSTTKEGLWVLDANGQWRQYCMANYPQLRSDNFRVAYETDNGMLVGTDDGAYLVTEDGLESVVKDGDEMNCRILSIGERDGVFYFGTDGYGMYVVKDGSVQEHLTIENGLCSNVVMKIRPDAAKRAFWLVTGNNLVYYDPDERLTDITFPSSNNLDAHVLEDGNILIFTGSGVYLTSEDVLLGKTEQQYKRFTRKDGLPYDITANSTPCMTDRHLYLCGSGGVIGIDLLSKAEADNDFSLVIDYLIADDKKYYVQNADHFTMPKDVQRIEIHAHLVTNTMENPDVFYYMEGFDKSQKRVKANNLDPIVYTNLSGGDYTFHFGIYDDALNQTGKEITLQLTKEYKWFENPKIQIVLSLIAVLLLAGIICIIVKLHGYSMKKKLKQEYAQRERAKLEKLVYIDHMTGLYNRHYLDIWERDFLESRSDQVTFLTADCNDLKRINDEFGHEAGDQLLTETSDLLCKYFTAPTHTVFRMGGDEFLVLCREEAADAVRKAMDEMLREAKTHKIGDCTISLCYGVHTLTRQQYNMDEGIRVADMEMLRQKKKYHRSKANR